MPLRAGTWGCGWWAEVRMAFCIKRLPFSTAARWRISLSETPLLPAFRALAEIRAAVYTGSVYCTNYLGWVFLRVQCVCSFDNLMAWVP